MASNFFSLQFLSQQIITLIFNSFLKLKGKIFFLLLKLNLLSLLYTSLKSNQSSINQDDHTDEMIFMLLRVSRGLVEQRMS